MSLFLPLRRFLKRAQASAETRPEMRLKESSFCPHPPCAACRDSPSPSPFHAEQQAGCIRVARTQLGFERHKLLNLGAPGTVQHRLSSAVTQLPNIDVLSPPCRFICLLSGPSWPLYLVAVLSNLHQVEIFQATVTFDAVLLSLCDIVMKSLMSFLT